MVFPVCLDLSECVVEIQIIYFFLWKICKEVSYVYLYIWTMKVAIHYYGRLAAKQGWRFDSTYDHKDETGDPMPFVFTVGAGNVR